MEMVKGTTGKNSVQTAQLADFKHKRKIKLRWRDINANNHINSNIYMDYLEKSCLEFLQEVCNWELDKVSTLLSKVHIEYLQPLTYEDKPFIYTRCVGVTETGLQLEYIITNEVDENNPSIVARGTTEMLAFNLKSNTTTNLPTKVKETLGQLEN